MFSDIRKEEKVIDIEKEKEQLLDSGEFANPQPPTPILTGIGHDRRARPKVVAPPQPEWSQRHQWMGNRPCVWGTLLSDAKQDLKLVRGHVEVHNNHKAFIPGDFAKVWELRG